MYAEAKKIAKQINGLMTYLKSGKQIVFDFVFNLDWLFGRSGDCFLIGRLAD